VLTLALGIGGSAALFGLVDQLLLQDLPVRDARQLVSLVWSTPRFKDQAGFPFRDYEAFQQRATPVLADVAAVMVFERVAVAGLNSPEMASAEYVSGNYFSILGMQPALGRSDDQFGGPEPDANHLTGVILRLNEDGSAPADNPFVANPNPVVKKVFSYGVRNSFGMAVDPYSGNLWTQENGDDSFDEINRVEPGMDGGWIQIIGPVSRIAQFKQIETTMFGANLQQLRWPPSNIADSPQEALSRLVLLPGAHYKDPEFSWKYAVAPGGIGFVLGRALGPQYEGDLIVGAATPNLAGGYLFHFNLTGNRQKIGVDDPRLEDRVADNTAKFDPTESESLMFGRDFGVTTDIQTGPNGNLFVVSLSKGSVFEIYRSK
jgi:glucose/sorbosone dehydrogenase/MacB-like protein